MQSEAFIERGWFNTVAAEKFNRYLQTGGVGIDIGSGGVPVFESFLSLDCAEHPPYGNNIQLRMNALLLPEPFQPESFDFVFSSHLLEDFFVWVPVLQNWWKLLKPGGLMMLLVPHCRRYRDDCLAKGLLPNGAHQHEFEDGELSHIFGPHGVFKLPTSHIVEEPRGIYSIGVIVRKPK